MSLLCGATIFFEPIHGCDGNGSNGCIGKGACLKRLDGESGRPFDSNADRACLLEDYCLRMDVYLGMMLV